MLDDHGFEIYEQNQFPLAYLLTFRTFGTWLHGDKRLSVGRNGRNIFRSPKIEVNPGLEAWMVEEMSRAPVMLSEGMRKVVESSISELCSRRGYRLYASNVRTNHVHAVIGAQRKPERIINDLKANATRLLRLQSLVESDGRVWSRGRSRRYLWKPRHVDAAIDYVLYGQGDIPFELPD